MLDEVPKRRPHADYRDLAHPGSFGPSPIQGGLTIRAWPPGRTKTDPLSRLASSEADELDAESWADLVARCLSRVPPPSTFLISIYMLYIDHLSERIASQRRLRRIDERGGLPTECTPSRRLLVARYPPGRSLTSHSCMSFTQMAKNAWNIYDRAAVERNWKLALDEARRALVLDPQDARADVQVADLQKRLDLLLASKPAPRD